MKLNKQDISTLMKGLLVNTFSVMEFKDPELRLPKYPMNFTVLSESLEVERTDDGLPMTDFLVENTKTDFLNGGDTDAMICNLNKCMENSNIALLKKVVQQSKSEKDLATGFGIHLISKLAGNASIKTGLCEGNKCPCGCTGKLQGNSDMWIGSKEIWYGELDIIAGNKAKGDDLVAFALQKEDETEEIELEEERLLAMKGSPDEMVNVEIKSRPTARNMSRVVAQSIVFAFTEWNRNREKGRLIPSVLLSPTFFQVVIYNPVDDFLFQSNKFYFSFDENDYRPFFILWIVLNHRIFFLKELSDNLDISCSGFQRIMNSYPEKISIFEEMKSYKPQILVERSIDTGHAVYSNEMIYRDCYIKVRKRCLSESD